jgi:5-methylcytosine-specific restriction endonuclease McrA
MYESTVTTPELRLAHGLALLEQAIDALSDVELSEASSVGLGEATLALGCQARRLSAVHARTADRFSTSGAWAADAARHARGWLVGRSNDSLGAIRGVLDTGAQLRAHPVMAEAVRDGSVSAAHLRVLADMHRRFPRLSEPLLAQEAHIVSFARLAAPRRFEADLLALCHRLNPEQVAEDEGARETATYLHASTIMDGMVRVDALLPADIGSQFIALLESARRVLSAEQREHDGHDVFGTPIPVDELPAHLRDPRVPSQRNVEAFRRILNGAAAATDSSGAITLPAVNGSRPLVHVTIPLDSLLADSRNQAAGWLERFGIPIASISAVKAQALVCDGVVRPLIIDRKGHLIATLPGTRAVPPVLRRAVMMRDVHCRIPHCDARIDEVHHVVFASQGGATTIQNLVGLCWYHHHAIHKGTWQLTGDANSELILTHSIRGQSWSSRPPPAQGDSPTNTRTPFPESDHVVIS